MPRKSELFRRELSKYLKLKTLQHRQPKTIRKYELTCLRAFQGLQDQNMETNPTKITEREASAIIEILGSREWETGVVARFLEWCGNPIFKQMYIQWPKKQTIGVGWLRPEEIVMVLKSLKTPMEELLVALEFKCMLRPIDVRRLTVDSFHDGVIEILGKGSMGGKKATIPAHPDLLPVLDRYLKHRQELVDRALTKKPYVEIPKELLIYEKGGKLKPYGKTALENKIIDIQNRIRARGYPIHLCHYRLRKTGARMLRLAGAEVSVIQRILRHEHEETTRRYIGEELDQMSAAMDKLTDYLETIEMSQKRTKPTPGQLG